MATKELPPVGVSLSSDVEVLAACVKRYRARVRWIDPATGRRRSRSECFAEPEPGWARYGSTVCPGPHAGVSIRFRRQ